MNKNLDYEAILHRINDGATVLETAKEFHISRYYVYIIAKKYNCAIPKGEHKTDAFTFRLTPNRRKMLNYIAKYRGVTVGAALRTIVEDAWHESRRRPEGAP